MAQKVKYYCDFCGEEITRGDACEFHISIKHAYSRAPTYRDSFDSEEVCAECYNAAQNSLKPFLDFVEAAYGRNKPGKKEAAHE